MNTRFRVLLAGFSLVLVSSAVLAEDLEGRIESINKSGRSFMV